MRIIDLFSGCGGMSLGFMNSGFEVIAAFDNWNTAKEIYELNFNHPFHSIDLMNDTADQEISKLDFDMIIGGPPCQDFSIASDRNDKGHRANMTIRFAELVVKNRPTWFVMENVYNITRSKVLPEAISILKQGGYGLTCEVLDASYLGVPQARKRFFMIGKIGANDDFIRDELLENQSDNPLTIKEYFGNELDLEFYYAHPRSYNRRAVFSVSEASSTIRGVNRPIPENYKRHPADKSEIKPGIRPLTTLERSYVQTFPKSFKLTGSKTNIEQAIGNAVPVKMAEHVSKAIIKYLSR